MVFLCTASDDTKCLEPNVLEFTIQEMISRGCLISSLSFITKVVTQTSPSTFMTLHQIQYTNKARVTQVGKLLLKYL